MPHFRVWLIGCSTTIFLLCLFSINRDVVSDPKLTLLVSQAIVDQASPFLDAYREDRILGLSMDAYRAEGTVIDQGSRLAHYFPLGPSLLAVPVVAVVRIVGMDMRTEDNYALQEVLSAATAAAVFLLMVALARTAVSQRAALLIGLVSTLGSSLLSTLGTAFWSHNVSVLLIGGALWLLARHERGQADSVRPWLLGLLLFFAFLSRATAAAFIGPAFVYVALRERPTALLKAGLAAGGPLLVSLAWQAAVTGEAVPAYYSAGRLAVERAPVWVGLIGNLASPSRGVLVYSPFLIPVMVAFGLGGRRLWLRPVVLVCLAWFGLHLFLVARAASWWGGWSFGPRLLTDLWPGFVLLTALAWEAIRVRPRRGRDILAVAYLSLGIAAAFLHIVQGLYGRPASLWNGLVDPLPNPGSPLGDMFSWRYPQPLATNATLCALRSERRPPFLADYTWGSNLISPANDPLPRLGPEPSHNLAPSPQALDYALFAPFVATAGPQAFLAGWEAPHTGGGPRRQWSTCPVAEVVFRLGTRPLPANVVLAVEGHSLGAQTVIVEGNGRLLGRIETAGVPARYHLDVPATALRPGLLNVLTFRFPDARRPTPSDHRSLGLFVEEISLHELSQETGVPGPQPPAYPAP